MFSLCCFTEHSLFIEKQWTFSLEILIDMKNLRKIDSDIILTAAIYFTAACGFLACISGFYNQKIYYQILLGYCEIAVFAVMGILLYKGVYFSYRRHFLYLSLPL